MERRRTNSNAQIRAICFTGVMAALIFVFTFTCKIPLGTGYTHIGDSVILLSIALLGSKKSSLAAGVGAALADLIGGYTAWVLPTFFIKLIMVLICGVFAEKLIKNKIAGYLLGAVLGGVFQVAGYTVAKVILYDKTYALTTLPELVIQTIVGIVVAFVLIAAFDKTRATEKLRKIAA